MLGAAPIKGLHEAEATVVEHRGYETKANEKAATLSRPTILE